MSKFNAGKVSLLALTAIAFLSTFLLVRSLTPVLATSTHINDPVITTCGPQGFTFSGYYNESPEDNSGPNREQFRLRITLDSSEILLVDNQGSWSSASQPLSVGGHTVVAQEQHRTSSNSGSTWTS